MVFRAEMLISVLRWWPSQGACLVGLWGQVDPAALEEN